MNRTAALICLLIFTVLWAAVAFLQWLPPQIGDCMTGSFECRASKLYEPSLVLWRGLAIELLAVVAYLLIARRRNA